MEKLIKTKKVSQLPSGFLPYPKGIDIRFEPITVGEKLQLSEADLTIRQIYEYSLDKILVTGMNKRDLTLPDFIYIGVLRRLYAEDDVTNIHITYCPKCGHKVTRQFLLSEIGFDELKLQGYPIKASFEDKILVFKPLTIGDTLDMLEKDPNGKDTVLNTYLAMLDKVLDTQGNTLDIDKEEFILNSSEELVGIFKEVDELYYHGMQDIDIACPNKDFSQEYDNTGKLVGSKPCGNRWKEDYGSPATIIFPSDRHPSSVRSKITFG